MPLPSVAIRTPYEHSGEDASGVDGAAGHRVEPNQLVAGSEHEGRAVGRDRVLGEGGPGGRHVPAFDQGGAGVLEGVEEVDGDVVLGAGEVDRAVGADHGRVLEREARHHRALVLGRAGGEVEADDDVAAGGRVGHVDRVAEGGGAAARGDRAEPGTLQTVEPSAASIRIRLGEVADDQVAVRREDHAVVAAGVDVAGRGPDHRAVVLAQRVHLRRHRCTVARAGREDQAAVGGRDPGRPVAGLVRDVDRPQLGAGGEVHGHHRRALGRAAELGLADHEDAVAVGEWLPRDERVPAVGPEQVGGRRTDLVRAAVAS